GFSRDWSSDVCSSDLALREAQKSGALPDVRVGQFRIERPTRAEMGDYATSVAMQMAASTGRKPKTLAKALRDALARDEKVAALFSRVEVAPPGFINFFVSDEQLRKNTARLLRAGTPSVT